MNVSTITPEQAVQAFSALTKREQQVVALRIVKGSAKASANALGISVRTAQVHCERSMHKLGAVSFEQVAVIATKAGRL